MPPDTVRAVGNRGLLGGVAVGAPVVLVAALVGLVISVFRAAARGSAAGAI